MQEEHRNSKSYMNCRLLIILSALVFSFYHVNAQGSKQVDSIYNNALVLYEQKAFDRAKAEFEKVIILSPRHKDAIFNLAVINYEQGNKDQAIGLFQTCVKLKDRNAADLLKNQLGQQIAYADTMHLDDVDTSPKVLVNSEQEEIIVNKGLNRVIEKKISDGFRKSKILKKEVGSGKKIFLFMYFGKDGRVDAEVLGKNQNQSVQAEITTILQSITIIPAKYKGKEVVTWGLTLPVVI